MPQGASLGIRSAANSAAMNINVNISWYNADRLYRSFNNTESELNQRFESGRRRPRNPVNLQTSKETFDIQAGVGTGVPAMAAAV